MENREKYFPHCKRYCTLKISCKPEIDPMIIQLGWISWNTISWSCQILYKEKIFINRTQRKVLQIIYIAIIVSKNCSVLTLQNKLDKSFIITK